MLDKIARAVLYEGYLLYPYRRSALKNRQRWNFGVLYPPAWAAAQTGSDRSYFQMECVAIGESADIDVSVRFLRLRERGGRQEATEEEIRIDSARERVKEFAGGEAELKLHAGSSPPSIRVMVRVRNTSGCKSDVRDEVLLHSLASAHAVLHIRNGEFISQTDPPEKFREAVDDCRNIGVWPVLVGDPGTRDTMLGSPIILYDYPQVAPESQNDLFDATEIDEILSLRILTLSDEEKEEIRRTDERARRILEDLEANPEHLLQLHGRIQTGSQPKKGDRVRLWPKKRADIFDTLLAGKIAIIEAVEEDFEGKLHFAVVIEDDPGRDLGEMRQAGHRFFFSAEEVERITP